MKKFVIGALAIVGALSILTLLFAGCVGMLSLFSREPLPSSVILEVDLERGLIESIPDDLVASMMLEEVPVLRDVVDAIDRAAGDRRVRALIARCHGAGIGLAHIQEIRDAVMRFRDAGKPAWAFAETFGEFGPGNGGYYLATAFDEIWLQPSGDIGLTGLMYESPFVRGLLDKLSVTPRMGQRYEYKNAMNYYTDREYSEPYREAMQELADSQFAQMVRGVALARGLDEAAVIERFNGGPYLGQEAVDAGLVDRLAYRDEVIEAARAVAGERARLLPADRYLGQAGRPNSRGTTIALIHGHGAVTRGRSSYSPVDGSMTMGSDTLTRAFRSATEDKRVRAILFRVDSPGGSYVASDTIWRETIRAREAGKPVVVSMGNLAGSGGYFVAMHADRIVAQPGTITASIGVLGGKMLTREFWGKLGITWDDVKTSENAEMWSPRHDYDRRGYARFEAGLDRVYEDFTSKVAEGRGLPMEQVLAVAKGRIWTGEDALERGLVDELGGLHAAMGAVREALGLAPDADLRLREFPRRRTQLEMLAELYGAQLRAPRAALVRTLRSVQPAVRTLRQVGLAEPRALLSMPEPIASYPEAAGP